MLLQDMYVSLASPNSSQNVLVVSPHPDDDVIGMGGKMALMAQKSGVFTLYVTDGSGSLRQDSRESIPLKRKEEALEALAIVKAHGAFFLNAKSSCLKNKGQEYGKFLASIKQIFEFLKPQEVYITGPWEIHPTHLASSQLILDALKDQENISIYGYPVWGPILGKNLHCVDITEVIEIKNKAIQAHQGEVLYKPYHEGVVARNFYQAIYENPHSISQAKYIEIFLDMNDIKTNLKEYACQKSMSYINEIFSTFS
ncbi:MAG: PIG-L family deacetylase [Candidatus Brocadiae bacterium]|nr:PIG-L family deacetylase [Candidatus Brocadiia bacterium]